MDLPLTMWRVALDDPHRTPLFIVWVEGRQGWDEQKACINKVIRGRVVEFSTVFLFVDRETIAPLMAAYRSSNYKAARVFCPKVFPVEIDSRYLKGMQSVYGISREDGWCPVRS